ncbi:MAG TPA: GNAT family N-acetyltransferase [Rhodanobacteraceae bacterium]|nr:GNAT family N-acetyltransferase [Rhodanobacteraceae bacterium]
MVDSELDNPFWTSLCTRHRHLALGTADAKRYPPEFAPFLGVAGARVDVEAELGALVAPDETVLLLGVAPRLSDDWRIEPLGELAQMVRSMPIEVPEGPKIVPLGEAHRADVLALTALVYPHYFRPRTMELGRYFGMYMPDESGNVRLAAMIGERLGTGTHTEMSAICTHPDFAGRGHASRLIAFLTNDALQRGCTPFLHVSFDNPRAKALYERLGYRLRRTIPFWSLRRA